jgi:hypothetical protein
MGSRGLPPLTTEKWGGVPFLDKVFQRLQRAYAQLRLFYHGFFGSFFLRSINKKTSLIILPIVFEEGGAQRGYAILNGFFIHQDANEQLYQKSWASVRDIFEDSDYFLTYLCRFEWLKDLKATGDMSARRLARRILEFWIDQELYKKKRKPNKKMQDNSDLVLSHRISYFILFYDFFGASATESWKKKFFINLQKEYVLLKKRLSFIKNPFCRLSGIRALLEYNVFFHYDSRFFSLLLSELNDILDKTHQTGYGAPLYRRFLIAIGIRNALSQWEKNELDLPLCSKPLYKRTLQDIRVFIQVHAQKIRWSRHTNGELCRFPKESASIFFEPVSSWEIDRALSQVEDVPPFVPHDDPILKGSNAQSVLFVNTIPQLAKNCMIESYCPNILNNVMDLEWSFQSHMIIKSSWVALCPSNETEERASQLTKKNRKGMPSGTLSYTFRDSPFTFCGTFTGNTLYPQSPKECRAGGSEHRRRAVLGVLLKPSTEPTNSESFGDWVYWWKRTLVLSQNDSYLQGVDALLHNDSARSSVVIFQYALNKDIHVSELSQDSTHTHGELSLDFSEFHKKKPRRAAPHRGFFQMDAECPFSLSARKNDKALLITIIGAPFVNQKNHFYWSFSLEKSDVYS